jgi:hypothetical protein
MRWLVGQWSEQAGLVQRAVWTVPIEAVPVLGENRTQLPGVDDQVAGRRWTIEESIQTGKGVTGLDQHQVRLITSPPRPPADCLHWSHWRRRHQARARQCRYQRQSTEQT